VGGGVHHCRQDQPTHSRQLPRSAGKPCVCSTDVYACLTSGQGRQPLGEEFCKLSSLDSLMGQLHLERPYFWALLHWQLALHTAPSDMPLQMQGSACIHMVWCCLHHSQVCTWLVRRSGAASTGSTYRSTTRPQTPQVSPTGQTASCMAQSTPWHGMAWHGKPIGYHAI
jgi:hypothetical protein